MTNKGHQSTAAKIGLLSIGLEAYWAQFPGLRDRLIDYHQRVHARIRDIGADVVSAGLIDSAPLARAAGDTFAREQVDIIFCHAATYATSSQVLPAFQAVRVPVVLLALQPTSTLDYIHLDTGGWLASCSACCVPEIAGACTRARIPYDTVAGTIEEDDAAWAKITAWVRAAGASRALKRSRIGFLGHFYPGMLDMYTDFTAVQAQVGAHIEILEIDDLAAQVARVNSDEVNSKISEMQATFAFANPSDDLIAVPIEAGQLEWSARVAAGLDRLADEFDLQGLTYYHRGLDGNDAERLGAALIVGNSLLTARGVITSGEGDLKTNIAQLILDRLGCGGSFTEFYALDFRGDFVLMGHDGPGHIGISQDRPVLRSLKMYHGKRGAGLSVEFKVKFGPITIVGCTQTADGRLKLIAAQGESIQGDTMQIGNTNSRLRFQVQPGEFLERWCTHGPTHHVALGIGHCAHEVQRVASLLGLEYTEVGQ